MLQVFLRDGRSVTDDVKLRALAAAMLDDEAKGQSPYVSIQQLHQVCVQPCSCPLPFNNQHLEPGVRVNASQAVQAGLPKMQ